MSENNIMLGTWASGQLTSGTAVVIDMRNCPLPATVSVKVVAGDTVTVSFSLDNGTSYIAWSLGDITSVSDPRYLIFYSGVTHFKFQRTAGTGTTSTYGIC